MSPVRLSFVTGVILAARLLVFSALAAVPAPYAPINPGRLSEIIRTLSSDLFEGRDPGTPGADRTVHYLVSQFEALGLEPGGEKGGWTQDVPLIRMKISPSASIRIWGGAKGRKAGRLALHQLKEIYLTTSVPLAQIKIKDSSLVFVGYGVSAPARGWDDFKDADLKGKIAVILTGGPEFMATRSVSVDERFSGRGMSYSERWIYKFEEAARHGAIGALIIHDTMTASPSLDTRLALGGETVILDGASAPKGMDSANRLLIEGSITVSSARQLFGRAGLDLTALTEKARQPNFRPVALVDMHVTTTLAVTSQIFRSCNVMAKLSGRLHPEESIIYGAHWDALGKSRGTDGKVLIRRGAIDDASGVAAVLEIARAFKAGPVPDRTIVFGVWTAEARGLLGSTWYVEHPLFPLSKTVANFTIDVLQMAGRSRTAILAGIGQDSLQDDFATIAGSQGRVTRREVLSERGIFYDANHSPFARAGVPVLPLIDLAAYPDLIIGGLPAGRKWHEHFMACYDQNCDVSNAVWDLRGAAEDVAALYDVGRSLAFSRMWPRWREGMAFKVVRDLTEGARPGL